jgi:hypothetical protein
LPENTGVKDSSDCLGVQEIHSGILPDVGLQVFLGCTRRLLFFSFLRRQRIVTLSEWCPIRSSWLVETVVFTLVYSTKQVLVRKYIYRDFFTAILYIELFPMHGGTISKFENIGDVRSEKHHYRLAASILELSRRKCLEQIAIAPGEIDGWT